MFFEEKTMFLESINDENDMHQLIRGHLYIESKIISLIEVSLPFHEELKISNLNFPNKVDLCASLGMLKSDEKACLKELNSLRNKVAHKLDTEISIQDAINIINKFPPQFKKIYQSMKQADNQISEIRLALGTLYACLSARINLSNSMSVEMLRKSIQILQERHYTE